MPNHVPDKNLSHSCDLLWNYILDKCNPHQNQYIDLKNYYEDQRQFGSGRSRGDIGYMIVSMLVACQLNGERLGATETQKRLAAASAVLAAALIRLPSHSTLQALYRSLYASGENAALAELRSTLARRTDTAELTPGLVVHGFNRAGSAWRGGAGEQAYKDQITQEYLKLRGWFGEEGDSLLGIREFGSFSGPKNTRVRSAFIRYFGDPDTIISLRHCTGRHGSAPNTLFQFTARRGILKYTDSYAETRVPSDWGGIRAVNLVGAHINLLRKMYRENSLNIHFSGEYMTPEHFVKAEVPTTPDSGAKLLVTERFFDSFDETSRMCYMVAAMMLAVPPHMDFVADSKISKEECLELAFTKPHLAISNAHNYAFFLHEVSGSHKEPSSLLKWLWRC